MNSMHILSLICVCAHASHSCNFPKVFEPEDRKEVIARLIIG